MRERVLLGQDPYVVSHDGSLILLQTGRNDHTITASVFEKPEDLVRAKPVTLWKPDRKSDHRHELWAPEAHLLTAPDGEKKWYIPYAASDGDNRQHRTYVLESETSDPLGPYHEMGRPFDRLHDHWAIDMTYLEHEDGNLYGIWSGTADDASNLLPQNLYIAPMSNPWTISGERKLISSPEHSWERSVAAINEGPQILRNGSKLFVVYSADASWSKRGYKLGLLEHTGGNVMDASSWIKNPEPVFDRGGAGHASFVKTAKGENVIVFHRKLRDEEGWSDRIIEHEVFHFDPATGRPVFRPQETEIFAFPQTTPVTTGFVPSQVA